MTTQANDVQRPPRAGVLDRRGPARRRIVVLCAAVGVLLPIGSPRAALLESTYLGGRGDDLILSMALGPAGDLYVCGTSTVRREGGKPANFPTTPGVLHEAPPTILSENVFVSRFSPDLRTLTASSYAEPGSGTLMALDPADGSVVLASRIRLYRMSPDLRSLLGTFVLQVGLAQPRAIHLAADGSVLLAGETSDPGFPATPGAWDTSPDGYTDGFVIKVDRAFTRVMAATLIGGGFYDLLTAITTDASGNVLVTGFSNSGYKDFAPYPSTPGVFRETSFGNGKFDVVVTKFDPDLTQVLASTYLASEEDDRSARIFVGPSGRIFVAGSTKARDFPTTEGAIDRVGDARVSDGDVFLSRFDPDLRVLEASTLFGEAGQQEVTGLTVDDAGIVTIVGYSFPLGTNRTVRTTPGAFQEEVPAGNWIALFISRLNSDFTELMASTLFASAKQVDPEALACVAGGDVYVAGWTDSWNLPTVPGSYDPEYNGGKDGFAIRLTADLRRDFPTGHPIRGRATGDGLPLSGVRVELEGPHGGVAVTGDDGGFVFPLRPAGPYRIRVEREYYVFADPARAFTVAGAEVELPEFRAVLGSTHGWTDLSEPLRAAAQDPASAVLPLLTDLHFVTDEEGWVTAVGKDNIYHTTNGGLSWEAQNTLAGCYAIHMLNATHGYAAGESGHVYQTTNGGKAWTWFGFLGGAVNDLHFPPGGEEGCCVGASGAFGWITAQGVTIQRLGIAGDLSGVIRQAGQQTAWIVGHHGWRVTTAGKTSLSAPSGYFSHLSLVETDERVSGWMVGDHGLLAYTTNGTSFAGQSNPDLRDRGVRGVHALNESEAWAVGDLGIILHSTDGGETWRLEGRSLPEQNLLRVFAVDGETAYAVGANGTFFKHGHLVTPAPDRPRLLIDRSGPDVLLRWPATFMGFAVESSPQPGGGEWSRLTPQAEPAGDYWVATNRVAGASQIGRAHV